MKVCGPLARLAEVAREISLSLAIWYQTSKMVLPKARHRFKRGVRRYLRRRRAHSDQLPATLSRSKQASIIIMKQHLSRVSKRDTSAERSEAFNPRREYTL